MTCPHLGLWLDDPPKVVLREVYFDQLVALGVRVVAVMIDTSRRGWDPKWSVGQLNELRQLALSRDIEVVLTCWPEPDPEDIDAMVKDLPRLLVAAGASALEIDTERNWRHDRVRNVRRQVGRSSLDLAGDHLVAGLSRVRAQLDVRLELTTFTSHTENGRSADVAPHMDRLVPQAYSVRERNGKLIPWSHSYGPGGMQRFTIDRTLLIEGPKLSVGLAAYDQAWPGHTAHEAMEIAWLAALAYDPMEIRFWSSKWVLGVRANGYAADFLRSRLNR